MGRFHYNFSKTAKKEFAIKMDEINEFCLENNICSSRNNDSYYFRINNQDYRVSNHTIAASNRGAYNEFGEQMRELYHDWTEREDVVYITASKTRLIEIYNNLKAGKKLNRRGYIVEV